MTQQYEYTPLYYGTPCQVRYFDVDEQQFRGGIAYQDFIICGHFGSLVKIEDVIKSAAENNIHWDDAVVELEWVNISTSILL